MRASLRAPTIPYWNRRCLSLASLCPGYSRCSINIYWTSDSLHTIFWKHCLVLSKSLINVYETTLTADPTGEHKHLCRREGGWAVLGGSPSVCSSSHWSQFQLIKRKSIPSPHFNSHSVTLRPSSCQSLKCLTEICPVCESTELTWFANMVQATEMLSLLENPQQGKSQWHWGEIKFPGED